MTSEPFTLIHPSAVVDPTARLGEGSFVGPFAVVEADVVLGDRCRIEAHAVIKRFTTMGSENHVCEGAVIGGLPQDLKYKGCDTYVRIGDRNVFREGVTIHRATDPGGATLIGNDNYLMAYAHVAHDCRLEDKIIMANNSALAGVIHVEDHAFISGGVMIHQFSQVGRYAMIGGKSKINRDVLPFFTTDGVPGRVKGLNLVGLKRAGFSVQELHDLKAAYRILLVAPGLLKEKLSKLREFESPHVQHLADFIERSKRGFCRNVRSGDV
jgi:UDP-N-acetylglucosamine acyltransferase